MKHTYWKMSLPALVFALTLGFFAVQVNWKSLFLHDVRQVTASPAEKDPGAVPQSTLSQIQQNLAQREYHISYDSVKSALQSPNRNQGIRAYYKPGKLTVVNRRDSAGHNFKLDLVNEGVFADGRQLYKPARDAQTELTENQLHIRHPGFTEEYINDSSGVRQNFIVERAPDGTRSLEVRLDVTGMQVSVSGENELRFSSKTASAGDLLSYKDLHCWDADNDPLAASLTYSKGQIRIHVNVEHAAFPVTIDPLVANGNPANATAVLEKDQTGSLMGFSVSSAGDVNGDGYSDVVVGASLYDMGEKDEGMAFVYHGSASGLPAAPNAALQINQLEAHFGARVATAGDVNGDGFSDIVIGATLYENGQSNEGAAFVYHGSANGVGQVAAAILEGNQAEATSGFFVSTAGDVNGDGFSDVIVGAPMYDKGQSNEGAAFIYRGSKDGVILVAKDTLESNQPDSKFGCSVMAAGDVDGNGYTDVIVGAYLYDNGHSNEGVAFVYHGSANGINKVPAATLQSDQPEAWFGFSVAGAGDVNGDGFSDVIVGAYNYDNGQNNEGAAMVFHGSAAGVGTTAAKLLESNQADAQLGFAVASAGDVNGDGFADVIAGANLYDNGQSNEGGAFIYEGSTGGVNASYASKMEGNQVTAGLGNAVASAGDINGDGYSDIVIGASHYSKGQSNEGAAFVWVGGGRGIKEATVSHLELNIPNSQFGWSVASAGDVNGDGFDDVLVVADKFDGGETDEGAVFIYHGSPTGLPTAANAILESNQTFARLNSAASSDVNGDGYSDIIVGIPLYDVLQPLADEGAVMIFYGSLQGVTNIPDIVIHGTQPKAKFGYDVSTAGDSNGDGFEDFIIGEPGYDLDVNENEGRAHMFYGVSTGINAMPLIINGPQNGESFGCSVSGGGDFNADGYDDVIVGDPYYTDMEEWEGAALVFYGSVNGINSANPVVLQSNISISWMGMIVSTAGDVNGDGFGDIGASLYYYQNGQKHATHIYYGSVSGIIDVPNVLEGIGGGNGYFAQVSSAGDVNGDGYGDLILGIPLYSNGQNREGAFNLYFGSRTGIISVYDAKIEANQDSAYLGLAVAGVGDINADGYSDIIAGQHLYDNEQINEGRASVYYGNSSLSIRNNLRLYNTNLTTPINHTQFPLNNFGAGLFAKSFLGRNKGKLVWETKPVGQGFSKGSNNAITNSTQSTSAQSTYTNLGLTGAELKNVINKQGAGTKVRARVKYDPVLALTGQTYGPWRYLPAYLMGNSTAPVPEEAESDISQTTKKKTTMESNEWREQVVVYPNPAFDRLNIQVKNPDQVHTIKLLNFTGEAVYQAAGFKSSIDISKLSEGVYFVVVTNQDGTHTMSKILIRE